MLFALRPETEKKLEIDDSVNERIVWYRLKGKHVNITIVQVYAPTDEKTVYEIDEFYEKLREVVGTVRHHDVLLLPLLLYSQFHTSQAVYRACWLESFRFC